MSNNINIKELVFGIIENVLRPFAREGVECQPIRSDEYGVVTAITSIPEDSEQLYKKYESYPNYYSVARGYRRKRMSRMVDFLIIHAERDCPTAYKICNDTLSVTEVDYFSEEVQEKIVVPNFLNLKDVYKLNCEFVESNISESFIKKNYKKFLSFFNKNDIPMYLIHPLKAYVLEKHVDLLENIKREYENKFGESLDISLFHFYLEYSQSSKNNNKDFIKCLIENYEKTIYITNLLIESSRYSDDFKTGVHELSNLWSFFYDELPSKYCKKVVPVILEFVIKRLLANPKEEILKSFDFGLIKNIVISTDENKLEKDAEILNHIECGEGIENVLREIFEDIAKDEAKKKFLTGTIEGKLVKIDPKIFQDFKHYYQVHPVLLSKDLMCLGRLIGTSKLELMVITSELNFYNFYKEDFVKITPQQALEIYSNSSLELKLIKELLNESSFSSIFKYHKENSSISFSNFIKMVESEEANISAEEIFNKEILNHMDKNFITQEDESLFIYYGRNLTKYSKKEGLSYYKLVLNGMFKKVESQSTPIYSLSNNKVIVNGKVLPLTQKTIDLIPILNEIKEDSPIEKIQLLLSMAQSPAIESFVKSYLYKTDLKITDVKKMVATFSERSHSFNEKLLSKLLKIETSELITPINKSIKMTSKQFMYTIRMLEKNLNAIEIVTNIFDKSELMYVDFNNFKKVVDSFINLKSNEGKTIESQQLISMINKIWDNKDSFRNIPTKKNIFVNQVIKAIETNKYTGLKTNNKNNCLFVNSHYLDYLITITQEDMKRIDYKGAWLFKDEETFERVFANTLKTQNNLKNEIIDIHIKDVKREYKCLEFEHDDLITILPSNKEELVQEGNNLNHCVGTYSQRIADRSRIVLFVRKKEDPNKSFYTVEIIPESSSIIGYVEGKNRIKPTKEISEVVKTITEKFKETKKTV